MFVAWDTETDLFGPGKQAPPLVCVSSMSDEYPSPLLLDHARGADYVRELVEGALVEDDITLVTHNGFYDYVVVANELQSEQFLKNCFELMKRGQVHDTMVCEWLLDNADGVLSQVLNPATKSGFAPAPKGHYGLARLANTYAAMHLDKESGVRVSFGPLRGIDIDKWPSEYQDYAKEDAVATLAVAKAQLERAARDERNPLCNMAAQAEAYLALQLSRTRGITTDLVMTEEYAKELHAEIEECAVSLSKLHLPIEVKKTSTKNKQKITTVSMVDTPLIYRNKDGEWSKSTKVLQKLVEQAYEAQGEKPPQTPTGGVKTDADTIDQCEAPELDSWKQHEQSKKILNTYVPILRAGIAHPGYGFTSNGRSSSFNPNIQNAPRRGRVRECYVARPGYYLCSVDYAAQELVTFAQAMRDLVGDGGPLMDAINNDMDVHTLFACEQLLKISYDEGLRLKKAGDEQFKTARQNSKQVNFGFPGGMGIKRFIEGQRKEGFFFTEPEAIVLKKAWEAQWKPQRYFAYVNKIVEDYGWVKQLRSGRVRGEAGFTDTANTFFSGLAADMSKDALVRVTKECYCEPTSPLYGSRVVAFIHDEILAEVPIDRAHEAAMRIGELMVEAGRTWCPDVKSKAEPALMRRWFKGVEAVFDARGMLQPWEPK